MRQREQDHDHDEEHDGGRGLRIEHLARPSITPRAKPVMIEPMIEPMPPITTTANTVLMKLSPMLGFTE